MRPSEVAERALLGALLLEPARRTEVEAWLEPSDFYAYRHALVYATIQCLHDEGVEPTARAVLDRILPDAESRRNVDGPYLHTHMAACPHPSRAAIYGRMVLDLPSTAAPPTAPPGSATSPSPTPPPTSCSSNSASKPRLG